jgi:seryl-tRNA synthetase
MDFLQWLGPSALIGLIGAVVKFSSDYSKLKTLTDGQQKEINRLEKLIENDRENNSKQHLEFYQNRNDTIELKADMNYVKKTLDKLVELLERRRAND